MGRTFLIFSFQSFPLFLLARGDAGEGCQQLVISTSRFFNAFKALFSAYFPTPSSALFSSKTPPYEILGAIPQIIGNENHDNSLVSVDDY